MQTSLIFFVCISCKPVEEQNIDYFISSVFILTLHTDCLKRIVCECHMSFMFYTDLFQKKHQNQIHKFEYHI